MADESSSASPKYQIQLMAGGTACLCLLLIVGVIVIGVLKHSIPPQLLGDKAGAGLVGVLYILYNL